MILWQGRVDATHLINYFKLSRQSAGTTFSKYNALHPSNIHYDESLKAFVASSEFKHYYATNAFTEYQQITKSVSELTVITLVAIKQPIRSPPQHLAQPILRAIENKLAIDIGYCSLNILEYKVRMIEPHSLIFDGLRWHVRAYCLKHRNFRDFVLTRFNGEVVDEVKALQDPLSDHLWHTKLTLIMQPDPGSSQEQQQTIREDYQMFQGYLQLTIRAALVHYLIRRLHQDQYQRGPYTQQLVLNSESEQIILQYRDLPVKGLCVCVCQGLLLSFVKI
jgi:predicted DNA-binding transcriptional regulator YafY